MTLTGNDTEASTLDQAARAGWLYYVGGMTQDHIARELGISRQRAQRLVSRAVAERLVHVRLEHPVAACLELEQALRRQFGLSCCRVAPRLGGTADPVRTIAPIAAQEVERYLRSREPKVFAVGTGRALRATVEEMTLLDATQHRLVSLIGNIAPDGSASFFDVIMRIADKVRARHYPMPVPVLSETRELTETFRSLPQVRLVRDLARVADVSFVGVGQMGGNAPLLEDGFVGAEELNAMQQQGAVGEIVGWVFDAEGRYLEVGTNLRVGSVRIDPRAGAEVIGIAGGAVKIPAIRAALRGRILNGLITDEDTARALLVLPD
ncbi:sugar-binding transcriptional regulator [Thioclava sp. BHET1]|nr:sugar-binding transcriptional regulator [Thioclava sp. BHET1]